MNSSFTPRLLILEQRVVVILMRGFVAMLRGFHMYDVGRTPEGEPIELPKFYADAERAAQAAYERGPVKVRSNGAP